MRKTGGKRSRQKGDRFEREIVARFQDEGFAAERVPLSGAAGGSFSGDITSPLMGVDRKWECKKRADGFRQLYDWIDGNYGLVIAADRRRPMVVLDFEQFLILARQAEGPAGADG